MSDLKPWEEAQLASNPIPKPWEEAKLQGEPTLIQKAKSYLGINVRDIGETANAFVNPYTNFMAGMAMGKMGGEVLSSPIESLKKVLPYKSVATGTYDFSGLKNLRESLPEQMSHPIEALKKGKTASTLATWALPLQALRKGAGLTGLMSKQKTLPASELLAGKLEHSTVENVAKNPTVNEGMSIYAAEDLNNVVSDAAKATINAKEKIAAAQNHIYKTMGITDDLVMPPEKMNEALINIKGKIDDFSKTAIGENKAAAAKANVLYEDLLNQSKAGEIKFGQLKSATKQVYDIADSNVTDMGRQTEVGRLYSDIGKELTKTKKSLLPVKAASERYAELMEAENIIRDTLRLDRVNGEQTLPLKIIRRFKDAEHGQFKEQLEKVNDIFKKNAGVLKSNPETADLINKHGNADFVDRIKLTQALHDVTTKRAVTPQGIGRIPGLAYAVRATGVADPLRQMVMLKRGVKFPWLINPEAINAPVSLSPFKTISKARALGKITGTGALGKTRVISNLLRKDNE